MQNLHNLWDNITNDQSLILAIISNVRSKSETPYTQVKIKPILIKGQYHYHFEYIYENKVAHENLEAEASRQRIADLSHTMKQMNFFTTDYDYQVLISKKMKVTIIKKPGTKQQDLADLSHNRQKQYIFPEGIPVPFLVHLGIMNKEGMVLKSSHNKFRQINRFVEMIRDIVTDLPQNKTLRIIDFGCGKSYLTFALHYYLNELCGLAIEVVGLDLKEDVITTCNNLVQKLGLKDIKFLVGDIEHYTDHDEVDMVVSLHACNTATDAAIAKAVKWNAKVILSVPCCHHELYTQIDNDILAPLLGYGIIKERFAALATDGIRAQILEILGYKAQLVEFIDMAHTPKNILIRAVKEDHNKDTKTLVADYKRLTSFLSAKPALANMLDTELKRIIHANCGIMTIT